MRPPLGAFGLTKRKLVKSAGNAGRPCMAMACCGSAACAATLKKQSFASASEVHTTSVAVALRARRPQPGFRTIAFHTFRGVVKISHTCEIGRRSRIWPLNAKVITEIHQDDYP